MAAISRNNPKNYEENTIPPVALFSENELRKTVDRCCADTIVKGVSGTFVGSLVSVLFLRRHIWPICLGAGFGLGAAYKSCEKLFQPTIEQEHLVQLSMSEQQINKIE